MNEKNFSSIAYLALGSNLGNRLANFNKCIKMINENKVGKIEKTSQIYESPCVDEFNNIVKEENKFLNSVIKISTELSPTDLLQKCKEIENQFKRKAKLKYYEAREIDIDIILYNNEVIDTTLNHTQTLLIPHSHMQERLFVLKPLLDIDINLSCFNRSTGKVEKIKEILNNLLINKYNVKEDLYNKDEIHKYDQLVYLKKTFNLIVNNEERSFDIADKTLLMGVINCTPDSFSIPYLKVLADDNKNSSEVYDKLIELLIKENDNIDIVDIGGETTRPGSSEVDPKLEFERIAPLILKIRSNEILKDKIISIDTRKSYVARESLKLGANIINDVSGGKFDKEIAKVTSEYFAPFVCMHSRDTPDKMNRKDHLVYTNGLLSGINSEMEERIQNIKQNSTNDYPMLDWNIIVDPGIGFSKNREQNLELIRNLDKVKINFPNILLTGHSKKKFIQETLKVNSDNTIVGDIVLTTASIERGANIIRVHDFDKIRQAVKMSDALFK